VADRSKRAKDVEAAVAVLEALRESHGAVARRLFRTLPVRWQHGIHQMLRDWPELQGWLSKSSTGQSSR
jgi:hypothetical protein